MNDAPSITLNFSSEVLALLQPKQTAVETDLLKIVDGLRQEFRKQMRPWLTYDEAAEYAGLCKSTIIHLCETKKLERHYLENSPRIHRDNIDKAFGYKKS